MNARLNSFDVSAARHQRRRMEIQMTVEALAALREEPMGGNAEAYCLLGLARSVGNGAFEDHEKSVRCYRTAIAKGDVGALYPNADFQSDLSGNDGFAAQDFVARKLPPSTSLIPANALHAFYVAVDARLPSDPPVVDASDGFDK